MGGFLPWKIYCQIGFVLRNPFGAGVRAGAAVPYAGRVYTMSIVYGLISLHPNIVLPEIAAALAGLSAVQIHNITPNRFMMLS